MVLAFSEKAPVLANVFVDRALRSQCHWFPTRPHWLLSDYDNAFVFSFSTHSSGPSYLSQASLSST